MNNEGKPKKVLAEELESLRREIANLHTLVLQRPAEAPGDREAMRLPAAVFDDSPLGMALVDTQLRIVKANKAICRILDYAEEEFLTRHIQDLSQEPHTCSQVVRQVLERALQQSKTEGHFLKKNGEPVWVQVTVSPVPTGDSGRDCCLLTVEDISIRKRAESSLHAEKQLLERLINSSLDGILAFDRDFVFTVWNPAMERIFGISSNQTLGRNAFKACPFLSELGEDANFAAALRGEKVISRDKSYSIPGTGRQGYFEGYYGPMYGSRGGEVIGGLAIIRDVTERRLVEEAKRLSEERYHELFENAYDMVFTFDLAGRIISINKAAERITGYARAEVLGKRSSQFVAPEYQQAFHRTIDRQLADEAPVTQQIDFLAKDGSRVTMEVSSRLVFQKGKPVGIQGIARDITERQKAEEALRQANKKLEAWVGELEQRTREMTLLSEMGDILRACLTKEEVYEAIVRVAQELFPLQGGALFVLGPLRNIAEAVAEWGDTSAIELTFSPEACWALRRGRIHWVEDSSIGLLCKHLQSPPPSGYLCIPMMAQSEALGILHLVQPDSAPMPEAKLRLAVAMAEHVAMALSNLRLHETLRNQSIRDQLTGLFNRSFMEESLEIELRRAVRTQHSFNVIMMSLDNFQLLSDSFGLDVGDSVLRRAGVLIQTSVRKGDIACRYSGQTYAAILPQTTLEVGRKRAEILRDLARTLEVKYQNEQVAQITVSIGLAVYPDHGQTAEALLRSVEAALNRARNSGGNCVVVAT